MFPTHRPRRIRQNPGLRTLVRETRLSRDCMVQPLFAVPGSGVRKEIASLPGQYHLSIDKLTEEARAVADAGVPAILLFGIPEHKDNEGSGAWIQDGIAQQATRALKKHVPALQVITDLCLCEYTAHGHCGIVGKRGHSVEVLNDPTLELLAKTAVSQAEAGSDLIAPSDMMDGRVQAIRRGLDGAGFIGLPIMSYAAKFCSAFYGPFREAAGSAPQEGDRSGYQMDPANGREALREMALDLAEGADILMVKPALPYLDVLHAARSKFAVPLAAYQVSGEYAQILAAARAGWLDQERTMWETLTAIRRAGADLVITYFARTAAAKL
ncbi:MAG: porphobilinogen synthase [Acidobacteria bacterium]|nr:MAG: porphobilinogen synthase [Acidobacteriota bacterium]